MNVLIIGLGSIAKKHIDALRKCDEDVCFFALRSSRGSEKQDGVNDVYSLNELNGIAISFIIISTPTAKHIESIKLAKTLNVPLFIEKPIYHTLDIKELVFSLSLENTVTYVACNLRFLDSLIFVKEEIEKNLRQVNEVNSYCGSYLPEWRPGIDFKNQYSARPEQGGGVHLDLIHELDYLYWLFGKPENVKKILRSRSSLGIGAIDYANYYLGYDNFAANIVLNYFRRDPKRVLEIVFDDETWLVNIIENTVSVGNEIIYNSNQTITDTYKDQISYFIECINRQKVPFNSATDGLNVLEMCI